MAADDLNLRGNAQRKAAADAAARQRALEAARNRIYGNYDVVAPPSTPKTSVLRPVPKASKSSQPRSSADTAAAAAAAKAAAAETAAKKAGKDQTAKENAATQEILNALMNSLTGFQQGRETQIKNAQTALDSALAGILASYQSAVADYNKTAISNEQDEASKSAANIQNRARERMSLLEQAASQGAGETDQLRAQLQAFLNFDANQLEVTRSFFDTQRGINSQIAGANSQAETSRRSAWAQNQEAIGQAENEFMKNWTDTWTNIQRTAAQNTNINSDYSTGFTADLRGNNAVTEASKYAGKAYETKKQDEKWFQTWDGREEGRDRQVTSTSRAGSVSIRAPKSAEGATLRSRR